MTFIESILELQHCNNCNNTICCSQITFFLKSVGCMQHFYYLCRRLGYARWCKTPTLDARFLILMIIQKNPLADDSAGGGGILFYMPMHEVAPRAVTIAVAILAIICTMNFRVSFLLIMFLIVSLVRLASPRIVNG